MMTACDLSAITKPWPVQRRVGSYNPPSTDVYLIFKPIQCVA